MEGEACGKDQTSFLPEDDATSVRMERRPPKSPAQREKKNCSTKWMPSARHLNANETQKNEEDAKSDCSSPCLLMPSFNSTSKQTDVSNERTESAAMNEDADEAALLASKKAIATDIK